MSKERLAAFTDAVLAIIMTVLVLELKQPAHATLNAIWDLRISFFSYALSFFWLGTMWVNLHNEWHYVKRINNRAVWQSVILLFFSSLFPYVTSFVDEHFNNSVAQGFYGLVVLAVTFANMLLYDAITSTNTENAELQKRMQIRRRWTRLDVLLKLIGLAISVTFYPPAMMYSVLITMLIVVIPNQINTNRQI